MNYTKTAYNDTVFLRFLAIILIVNSHMDLYYPIKYIGTGGAIGNTLFFMLSSFGIFLSQQKYSKDFTEWYSNRIKRIYPSVWVTILLIIIPIKMFSGKLHLSELLSFAGNFFYPPFWFLKALIIFYLIGWFLLNKFSEKKIFITTITSIFIYGYLYIFYLDLTKFSIQDIPFRLFYYFIVYIFGMYLASKNKLIKYSGSKDFIIALFSLLIIYGHKFLITKHLLINIQFIEQFFCIVLAYHLLKISRSPLIVKKLMNCSASKVIKYIGSLTLEIYIVHVSISSLFLKMNLSFPLNGILFLLSVVLVSSIVKNISSFIDSLSLFQHKDSEIILPQSLDPREK